ncbi:uncharacterized protein LOC135928799 [Gordionus sp. m RMFG-2023]|uniref:uncharacterized protein LOC135928799 n=1 Tax=Gordionus sp. m RMFG-2023 TaxID=3053472 RepID=UPI0031FDE08E
MKASKMSLLQRALGIAKRKKHSKSNPNIINQPIPEDRIVTNIIKKQLKELTDPSDEISNRVKRSLKDYLIATNSTTPNTMIENSRKDEMMIKDSRISLLQRVLRISQSTKRFITSKSNQKVIDLPKFERDIPKDRKTNLSSEPTTSLKRPFSDELYVYQSKDEPTTSNTPYEDAKITTQNQCEWFDIPLDDENEKKSHPAKKVARRWSFRQVKLPDRNQIGRIWNRVVRLYRNPNKNPKMSKPILAFSNARERKMAIMEAKIKAFEYASFQSCFKDHSFTGLEDEVKILRIGKLIKPIDHLMRFERSKRQLHILDTIPEVDEREYLLTTIYSRGKTWITRALKNKRQINQTP